MRAKKGLGSKLLGLLGVGKRNEAFFESLEDVLIEGDMGPLAAMEIVDELRERAKKHGLSRREEFVEALKSLLSPLIKVSSLAPERDRLNFLLVLGVNGVGKTTTIAKLAHYYKRQYHMHRILLAAGDTFRAAAVEQLQRHAEMLELGVISQAPGADPGAVIFDTIASAQARGMEMVLADTAGRMHNKPDLVRELEKIDKVIRGKLADGMYRKVLVLDATTGQNALHQAQVFHEAIGIDSIVLAKYDSTAKGGIVISIGRTLGLPFSFVGVGEQLYDLSPFDADSYLDGLLSE